MQDLATIFAGLHRHHTATPREPLPPPEPGVTWIWAGNGVWKRGVSSTLDLLICVHRIETPGLAALQPHARWRTHDGRIPGELLEGVFDHARRAGAPGRGGVLSLVEQQYFITWQDGADRPFQVEVPPQEATATSVRYELATSGVVLVDLHSHGALEAFFSSMDNDDDGGWLSVSAVIGNVVERPGIAVRLNVYGHHQRVRALDVFTTLPDDVRDTYNRRQSHASA
ncbi:MAG TPA: Mov34/MPN/PAD-1 family protein [Roseiflexaceae bacterium]|nr:Mov34/MPN/PAD-1 family protein [Roseiflexaceae bacterium]